MAQGRRHVLALLGAAAALPIAPASAERGRRPARIGFLSPATRNARTTVAFLSGLADLGHVEDRTIAIAFRFAAGAFERLPAMAAELVRLEVEIIVAAVTQAALAARNATRTIPIVMAGVGDPVGAGLVASLARPGGNITGTSSLSIGVAGKTMEILHEALPSARRVAVLWNPGNAAFQTRMLEEIRAAAGAVGVTLVEFAAADTAGIEAALAAIAAAAPGALLVLADPFVIAERARIVGFAAAAKLPAVYTARDFVEAGGLMAHGPDVAEQCRRAALYVDRILKGARPGDLPVEQPTKFDLVVNLRAAREIGVALPNAVLLRADSVIE